MDSFFNFSAEICFNYPFKVHLTPLIHYFRKNANFKLFQKRLNIFCNIRATVQLEICYQLVRWGFDEGHGSIPDLTSQTDLHACSQRVNAM